MEEINVIGDIAGNYLTLRALIDKMPGCETLLVGDMMDRGPKSKEVIDFVMNSDKIDSLMGNHEHMMVDHCRGTNIYRPGIWFYNGGTATVDSFGGDVQNIPSDVLDWLETRPLYKEVAGDTLITHAFLPSSDSLEEGCLLATTRGVNDYSVIWSRHEPYKRKEWKLQIAGHNAHWGYIEFKDEEGIYAVAIDTGGSKGYLTGIHLPTMETFTQKIVD